jgi:SAM-dependent methyltransferase
MDEPERRQDGPQAKRRDMDFSLFDNRGYPLLPVKDGYTAWAATYDDTVLDLMDLRVAEALATVRWSDHAEALDLACGTGRAGDWMRAKGVGAVDGVDATPAMLERARSRAVYRDLMVGDVSAVDRPAGAYSLVCQSLADEHLPNLQPLYREAFRLTAPGGVFVLLGYHPWFLMTGMAAHFEDGAGRSIAVESYVHLFADHVAAALAAGWRLMELKEQLIDEAWIAAKPKWAVHVNRPISFGWVWGKPA